MAVSILSLYNNVPDATKSVFNNAAMLEIHSAWLLVSSIPCASVTVHNDFFFKELQTQSCPSLPQLKKFSSLMSLTSSMELLLCPLNINCDSSTIFHILILLSKPPLVTARSRESASMDVMPL